MTESALSNITAEDMADPEKVKAFQNKVKLINTSSKILNVLSKLSAIITALDAANATISTGAIAASGDVKGAIGVGISRGINVAINVVVTRLLKYFSNKLKDGISNPSELKSAIAELTKTKSAIENKLKTCKDEHTKTSLNKSLATVDKSIKYLQSNLDKIESRSGGITSDDIKQASADK